MLWKALKNKKHKPCKQQRFVYGDITDVIYILHAIITASVMGIVSIVNVFFFCKNKLCFSDDDQTGNVKAHTPVLKTNRIRKNQPQ